MGNGGLTLQRKHAHAKYSECQPNKIRLNQGALCLWSVFGIETVSYVQMEDFMVQSYISKQ